jgi:hypothetical protein
VAGQSDADRSRPNANLRAITPDYLTVVGTRLLEGRGFAQTDELGAPPVALVSVALADRFLSGKAVGERLLIDDNNDSPRPVEIVGVVENVRQAALDLPPAPDIYLPLRQIHRDSSAMLRNNQFWMLKIATDSRAFGATFLTHLRAVDPDAAVSGTGSMRQYVDAWLGPRRFTFGLFVAFALTVSQRTAEIGLRMAIGATARDVFAMILKQAAVLGVAGAVLGLAMTLAAKPLLAGIAKQVEIDVMIFVATFGRKEIFARKASATIAARG